MELFQTILKLHEESKSRLQYADYDGYTRILEQEIVYLLETIAGLHAVVDRHEKLSQDIKAYEDKYTKTLAALYNANKDLDLLKKHCKYLELMIQDMQNRIQLMNKAECDAIKNVIDYVAIREHELKQKGNEEGAYSLALVGQALTNLYQAIDIREKEV